MPAVLDLSPRTDTTRRPARATEGQHWDGHLAVNGDGFTIQRDGRTEERTVPATQRANDVAPVAGGGNGLALCGHGSDDTRPAAPTVRWRW